MGRSQHPLAKHSSWRWPERSFAGNAVGFFVQLFGLCFEIERSFRGVRR